MAESTKAKGAFSTAKSKDKSSSFDLDMGDDFLKSFKSMSKGVDDAIDIDFAPMSKNKKKAFNFDNEDIDFNLDSDFGKISSFNIDLPDFDVSSPPKKDRKSKGTSKEGPTVAGNKKKGDDFDFDFDFKLDGFSFGSSQDSGEKVKNNRENDKFSVGSSELSREKVKNDQETKCTSKRSGQGSKEIREKPKNDQEKDNFSFGSSQESREKVKNDQETESSYKESDKAGCESHLNEDSGSIKYQIAQEHAASEAGLTLTSDSHMDIDKSHDTTKHSLPSIHTMSNDETSKLLSVGNEVALEKAKSSLQEKIFSNTGETDAQVEEETSLISKSETRKVTSSGLQEHVISLAKDARFVSAETDVNKKMLLDSDTNCEKSVLKNSSSEDVAASVKKASERNNFENDEHVLETNKDRTEKHSSSMHVANAMKDKMQDMKVSDKIQSPNFELSAFSLCNDIVAKDLKPGKRVDTGVIRSKFFMPSIKPAAQMQKTASVTEPKLSEFSNKQVGPIQHTGSAEIRSQVNKDDGTGSKAGLPVDSRLLPKPLQAVRLESYQGLGITMKGSQPESAENIRTLIGSSRPNEQKSNEGKSVPGKSQVSSKSLFTLSSRLSPTNASQPKTMSTPCSIGIPRNSSITSPIPTAKNIQNGGTKALPLKAAKRSPDSSSLKISEKLGKNLETSRTVLQKNMKSSILVDQHGGFKAISQAKDNSFTDTLKKMHTNSSMKRKAPETNSDLNVLLPLKRLSPSPIGSRGYSEGTKRIFHKQVNDHAHSGNDNKASYENFQISSCEVPMKVTIKELGTLSVIEDDDNIKKAQDISKGLDDICTKLRKMNEEAKELLVRSIVNNNKLLLLNLPIVEEKMHRLQKFAAGLMTGNH